MTEAEPSEHKAWLIPPGALPEWLALAAVLEEAGTVPCRSGGASSPPVADATPADGQVNGNRPGAQNYAPEPEPVDTEAWWPDRKDLDAPSTRMAVRACWTCPARGACLSYAVAADERFGVWGGLLPDERRHLRCRSAA
jgi:hypothetical protein